MHDGQKTTLDQTSVGQRQHRELALLVQEKALRRRRDGRQGRRGLERGPPGQAAEDDDPARAAGLPLPEVPAGEQPQPQDARADRRRGGAAQEGGAGLVPGTLFSTVVSFNTVTSDLTTWLS